MGRFESAGPMGTGRSQSDVAQCQHVGQLSRALLTLMSAPAAGLCVGCLVLTDRWCGGGDRLQPLQSGRPSNRCECPLRVGFCRPPDIT